MADWHVARKDDAPDTNEESWQDAVGQVAYKLSGRTEDLEEFVSIIANSDDALSFISHALEMPQHHLHAFRDLIKLASSLRKEVETEMKASRMIPDED